MERNAFNIIQIDNLEAPELDEYARLSEVQLKTIYEPKPGLFIAESPKVIERAVDSGCIPVSCLVEDKFLDNEAQEASSQIIETIEALEKCQNANPDLQVYTAAFEVLTKLTGFKLTRGMLCLLKRPALKSMEELCRTAKRIVILENVVNPTNVGAIFRSAAALNMDAVILTSGSSDPLYRRASRVSMGTVFQIPWTIMDKGVWPDLAVDLLHSQGFKTVAMALKEDSVNIDDEELGAEEKLAIIMGTEGEGLADCTISESDYTVMIPMSHGVDSLNVAAASAVAFWQLGKNNK